MKIYDTIEQGSDEWLQLRCGIITASNMNLLMTPSRKRANNDKSRAHVFQLAVQRITNYVEPQYISDAMLRGQADEAYARDMYHENFAPVHEVGFITKELFGTTCVGYSPDGLVGDRGLIEIKSRAPRFQLETIVKDEVPEEYMLQIQTGLMITGREYLDFISYCQGMPLFVKRVRPDKELHHAILGVIGDVENDIEIIINEYGYKARLDLIAERREEGEMVI